MAPPRRPPPQPPADPKAARLPGPASKEENAYIPEFISRRPFYVEETTDYLEHQRLTKKEVDEKWYDRGRKAGPAATKYRKGACENCGAMTHKAKDCLSRPRARGAKWTGRDIEADEVIEEVALGWDAKCDRWNGYDASEYAAVVVQKQELDRMRRAAQEQQAADEGRELEDGDRYAEESDMSRHQPTSTRQLRLREDTAKYLLNLDLESAKYDPKTRALVDGGATTDDKAAALFAEEGYLRASGEASEFERAQRYAWETQEKEGDTSLHLQANPTAGEFLRKKQREDDDRKRLAHDNMLRDKYGDTAAAAMPASLRGMAITESERFVEYDEVGLIKGAPTKVARSQYPEDVFLNNHTSVWGSWWSNFQWGYACCHSFVKNSYCTGEDGKKALVEAERHRTGVYLLKDGPGEGEEAGEEARAEAPTSPAPSAKKRSLEEMVGGVSEAELDEYRRKRTMANDPMAEYLGKDELVH